MLRMQLIFCKLKQCPSFCFHILHIIIHKRTHQIQCPTAEAGNPPVQCGIASRTLVFFLVCAFDEWMNEDEV